MYVDAHVHIYDIAELVQFDKVACTRLFSHLSDVRLCAASHSYREFVATAQLCKDYRLNAVQSFGVHPQNPNSSLLENVEKLIRTGKVAAVGEVGFDLFDDKFKSTFKNQQEVWNAQLDLATQYRLPIIVHERKARHLIFANVKKLKKLKAVIFHGWGGSVTEANSLLKAGVCAYFSLGKAILRGQKSVIAMAANFDPAHLLTETDAPYMTLKGEKFSVPQDIFTVTDAVVRKRLQKTGTSKNLTNQLTPLLPQLEKNFLNVYS